ncbi:hypothetical protein HDU98_011386 [Podochytrium sp. JEL0797]|nr:hypothetical protein HDU98_011386 [Podochytrium sp. JEL0797]
MTVKNSLQEHLLDDDEDWDLWEGFDFGQAGSAKEAAAGASASATEGDALAAPESTPPPVPEPTTKAPLNDVELEKASNPATNTSPPLQESPHQPPPQTQPPRYCRICFSSDTPDPEQDALDNPDNEPMPDLGRLISPCKCKGTMKYVHLSCLNEWRKRTVNNSSHFQCDQCKFKYTFERTKWAMVLRNGVLLMGMTVVAYLLLVILCGFLAKGIIWMVIGNELKELNTVSMDDLEDEWEELVLAVLSDPSLLSMWVVNWVHMSVGLMLLGFVGATYSVAGFGLYRVTGQMRRRRDGGAGGVGDGNGVLIAFMLIVGILQTLWVVFKQVKMFSRRSLEMMESRILDIAEEEVVGEVVA